MQLVSDITTQLPATNLLRRKDPHKNLARFYLVAIEMSLFGEVTLERRWGRIGTRGRLARHIFPSRGIAEVERARILAAKLRRGYRPAQC